VLDSYSLPEPEPTGQAYHFGITGKVTGKVSLFLRVREKVCFCKSNRMSAEGGGRTPMVPSTAGF
jgi:hypothetical protein